MDANRIIETARGYIGVPFRHCGRNRHGVDCVGLVLLVARDLGISGYEPEPYSRNVDPEQMRKALEEVCVSLPEIQPGAILFLKVSGVPMHLGIVTERTLIHAFEPAKRVVEVTFSGYWEQRVEAVYQWRQ